MQSTEKRIAALEAVCPADPFLAVRMEIRESESNCRLRWGIPPAATNVLFIQRVIVSPTKGQYAEH